MKVLFYVLSLVAIVAAIFFTTQNKAALEKEQAMRVETIGLNRNVTQTITETEDELKTAQAALSESKDSQILLEENISKLKSDRQPLQRELAGYEGDLETQQKELEEAEVALQELKNVLESLGIDGDVNMGVVKDRIDKLEDEKKNLIVDIEELETNIEGATNAIEKNRAEIGRLATKKSQRDRRMSANATEAVITAVDQEWGFVVIGAGSNTGFEPEGTLIVKRDGNVIAELNPSAVEPGQTIAEIDFSTISNGVRIQPGDRVIAADPATN